MSWHDPITTLKQMRSFAAEALELVAGKSQVDVETDRTLTLALTRLLELIGEAANRIDKDVRQRHPTIPWREIISLRNRLIHGYYTINFPRLWQILQVDLTPLLHELDEILKVGAT